MRPSFPLILRDHMGSAIEAKVFAGIAPHNLRDFEEKWVPELKRIYAEDAHWDWKLKTAAPNGAIRNYSVECAGATEGLMQVRLSYLSKLDSKHIVYLDYLQSAPWNRRKVNPTPLYRDIGTSMFLLCIAISADEELDGRVALHSLPGALSFYKEKIGMIDYGPDEDYPNKLNYLELDVKKAQIYLNEMKGLV